MRRVVIECRGLANTDEFWQRYLDAARPADADSFGRNLDAFWDALAGGPGWPGDCVLVFQQSDALGNLRASDGGSLLEALRRLCEESPPVPIELR
jgi:RNAse (barnase) inhibitor barstar